MLNLSYTPDDWQVHLIRRILQGYDSIFCAGTGYGKSLIFEGLAVLVWRCRDGMKELPGERCKFLVLQENCFRLQKITDLLQCKAFYLYLERTGFNQFITLAFHSLVGPWFYDVVQVFPYLRKFIIPHLKNCSRCKLFINTRRSRHVSHKAWCPTSHRVDFAGEHERKEPSNADLEEDYERKDEMEALLESKLRICCTKYILPVLVIILKCSCHCDWSIVEERNTVSYTNLLCDSTVIVVTSVPWTSSSFR